MKIRFSVSSVSKKSQEQLNMALLLQFILPFVTIHIPFYIIVILPFFGIAGRILADQVLYLFCWCPAINPILIIIMVKNIQDQLLPRKLSRKLISTSKKIENHKKDETFEESEECSHTRVNQEIVLKIF
ncbi:unnamed protein product [Caenorhabditis brenneri]